MKTEHILLTSLGTQARETKYQWGERTATALLAPLALVKLLDPSQRPNRVVAAVTQEAKDKTWKTFHEGIKQVLGFEPELVQIPSGSSRDEIRLILEKVARCVPENSELTLDVTQGLRHFPFIFYALVLYLTSLRGVKVRGAYYGMMESSRRDGAKPIVDLRPLLELPEWFHAVRMFRDQGTTLPIADLLEPLGRRLKKETAELFKADNHAEGRERNAQVKQVKDAVDWLGKCSFAYEAALPLELGRASRLLHDSIKNLAPMKFDAIPPLAKELTDTIASVAEDAALADDLARKGGEWKKEVQKEAPLDAAELERQAKMIDWYVERDQLPLEVGLMREWVVSWAIWKSGKTEETKCWLNSTKCGVRGRYERRLGAIGAFAGDEASRSTITPEQKEFGNFWNQLTDLRNALHHHGMRESEVKKLHKVLESVRCFWNRLRDKSGKIDLPDGGRLLLSPQGTKPGVLFSALKVAQPDTCLVICSDTSVRNIGEACEHAGFQGSIERIELTDPHGDFNKIKAFVEQARCHLLNAYEVEANVTGGTTLMGLIVQRLVEEAQKLDRPVRRFALIDRRPPAEQDSDPFVRGEHHWIDD